MLITSLLYAQAVRRVKYCLSGKEVVNGYNSTQPAESRKVLIFMFLLMGKAASLVKTVSGCVRLFFESWAIQAVACEKIFSRMRALVGNAFYKYPAKNENRPRCLRTV